MVFKYVVGNHIVDCQQHIFINYEGPVPHLVYQFKRDFIYIV